MSSQLHNIYLYVVIDVFVILPVKISLLTFT